MHRYIGWVAALALATGVLANNAAASVVMNGTRVIVSSEAKEKSVHFSNTSNHPYLVHAWVSRSPGAKDEAQLPFAVTPPIFKMDPNAGQTVRLHLLPRPDGKGIQDVEEVYYLNFSQLPAMAADDSENNRLVLQMRASVKIFLRPPALRSGPVDIAQQLKYRVGNGELSVENPTPFHVNINSIGLASPGATHPVGTEPTMIAPRSLKTWRLNSNVPGGSALEVTISTVNDYGAETRDSIALPRE